MGARIVVPTVCLLAIGVLAVCLASRPGRVPEGVSGPGHARYVTLSLGQPVQAGAIAIVPIVTSRPLSREKFITLAEATKRGLVEIIEIPGREEVNALEVRNRAELPLMLFSGELLLGGKQDRIVARDTIIPPRSSRRVEVFCVEHGRWEGEYKPFQSGDTIVPGEVRAAAQEFRSQSAVWDRVARKNAVAGVAPSTGTVRALVADPGIKRRVDAITARLRTAFEGNASAVGMICWIDGRIHTADLFANAGLFTAARDKMLRSYATDVVLSRGARSVPVDMRACRRFLADIQTSRRTVEESTESDALLRVGGGRVTGFESGRASMNRALPASAAPYGQPPRPGEVRPPWGTYSGYGHGTYRPSDR